MEQNKLHHLQGQETLWEKSVPFLVFSFVWGHLCLWNDVSSCVFSPQPLQKSGIEIEELLEGKDQKKIGSCHMSKRHFIACRFPVGIWKIAKLSHYPLQADIVATCKARTIKAKILTNFESWITAGQLPSWRIAKKDKGSNGNKWCFPLAPKSDLSHRN